MRNMVLFLLCLAALAFPSGAPGLNLEDSATSRPRCPGRCEVGRVGEDGAAAMLSLPKGKGAWVIEISRSGGMRPVKETVRLNSAGEISATSEQLRGGQTTIGCSRKEKLSARELLKIKAAVTAARPSAWKDNYTDPAHPVCCDQPTTRVKLQWREDKGKEQVYETSWYPGSYELVPADLKGINTFIGPLWNAIRERCDK